MAIHSKPLKSSRKAAKSRPDFPLFRHARGYWAKKVRGQTLYFGKIDDDPQGELALQQWTQQKDDLLAGRKPRTAVDGLRIRGLD